MSIPLTLRIVFNEKYFVIDKEVSNVIVAVERNKLKTKSISADKLVLTYCLM